MKTKLIALFAGLLVSLWSLSIAQEAPQPPERKTIPLSGAPKPTTPPEPKEEPTGPVAEPPAAEESKDKPETPGFVAPPEPGCHLAVCEGDLRKIVVLDEEGRMMSDVRSIHLFSSRTGEPPVVVCKTYSSWFEPTVPKVKQWPLLSLRIVSLVEFQQLVDGDALAEPATEKPWLPSIQRK